VKNIPEIPWRDIAGMRDIIVHEYFGISLGLVWRVATIDIIDLKPKFEEIFNTLKK